VLSLVAAGCGISLIPRLAGLCSTDRVVLRPLVDPPVRRLAVALRRGSGGAPHLAAVVRALVDAARLAEAAAPLLPGICPPVAVRPVGAQPAALA
jgi:DNA-binding transcriptional LysR family regulator